MHYDWSTLYAANTFEGWGLPAADYSEPAEGIFRAPHLVWSDIARSAQQQDDMALWIVCCDVLVLDREAIFHVPAFIFARRIEIVGDAGFSIDRTTDDRTEFILATQQIVSHADATSRSATLTVVDDTGRSHQMTPTPDRSASAFCLRKRETALMPTDPAFAAHDFLGPGGVLPVLLRTIFQIAALISTEEPDLAEAQLRWVSALTSRRAGLGDLSSDAHSMYQTIVGIAAQTGSAILVPQLDHRVYAEASGACMDLLRQRQARYDRLQAEKKANHRWIDNMRLSIQDKQNEQRLAESLAKQATDTARDAASARMVAARELLAEEVTLGDAQVDFTRGVKTWQRDEKIAASVDMALALGKMASQLPAIVASGGTLAAVPAAASLTDLMGLAGDGIKRVSKSGPKPTASNVNLDWLLDEDIDDELLTFEDASRDAFEIVHPSPESEAFAKRLESDAKHNKQLGAARQAKVKTLKDGGATMMTAGTEAKSFAEGILRIVDAANKAEALERASERVLAEAIMDIDASFGSIQPIGLDVVTGGAHNWDLLEVKLNALFDGMGAVFLQIGGARAFRDAIRRLVLKGKTMSMARLALAKANGDLANAMLRQNAAKRATRLYDQHLSDMEASAQRDAGLEQIAFGRVLDAKRSVWLAMEAYGRAFTYFTLDPTPIEGALPRITDSVDTFGRMVAKITGTWLTDITLAKAPQTLRDTVAVSMEALLGPDGRTIEWATPLDPMVFHGFYRLRLDRLRVYADGLATGDSVAVVIGNNGCYFDRTPDGSAMTFVTQPFHKRFLYRPDDEENPIADGDAIRRFADDFFEPTPFSTWRFRLEDGKGAEIDPATLHGLRISLQGSAITR